MEITISNKFKVLTPARGKVITQASVSDETERIISHQICIPLNSDEAAWIEWTETQAEAWRRKYQPEEEQEPEEE